MKKELKNYALVLFLTILLSCGYEPLNKNNTENLINISEKIFIGDNKINRKIFNKLNLKEKNGENGLRLELNTIKKIDGVSKDKSGNITTYKTSITVIVSLIDNDKLMRSKTFSKNFNYSNINNKFDLKKYQKDVEKNLINTLSREIKIYLYN
jgi:outer membrane lipopolysaccharide assembly protein LptE/RlpB